MKLSFLSRFKTILIKNKLRYFLRPISPVTGIWNKTIKYLPTTTHLAMADESFAELYYRELVEKAQGKSNPMSEISAFSVFKRNGMNASVSYSPVADLSSEDLKWILDLEKRNMEPVYKTCSWGWKQKEKEKEMTESDARYLVVKSLNDSNERLAFSHFRFDMDHGDPVLYCYELQVEPTARGKGLGKFMMQILELLAFKNNMMKVILTVLKHNEPAVGFFHSMNYTIDETNPVEGIFETIPYDILSKSNKNFKHGTEGKR